MAQSVDVVALRDFALGCRSHCKAALRRIEQRDCAVSHGHDIKIGHDETAVTLDELRHSARTGETDDRLRDGRCLEAYEWVGIFARRQGEGVSGGEVVGGLRYRAGYADLFRKAGFSNGAFKLRDVRGPPPPIQAK